MLFNLPSSILNPRSRFGGPRQVRPFLLLEDGFGDERFDFDRGGGFLDFHPIAPLPKQILTPTETALSLAGGLTLAQLDQAAKMETQEGAPIGVFYGKLLLPGALVAHKYTVGPPKKNEFTVLLGEAWGGLGARGEWNRIVKAWWRGQELGSLIAATFYVDDPPLPAGATIHDDQDGWNWVTKNPTPYAGRYAHQSPNIAGQHQHHFRDATQTFAITPTAQLFCWIWIDPVNTPTEIMLQWQDNSGSFEHRAYWGANSINLGTNGTASRFQVSASIPATGQWVRLVVGASSVGLNGQTIKGMGFTLFGGSATWDLAGQWDFNLGGTGYVFRHGYIATDGADMRQLFDAAIPSGLSHNGSANAFVRLTEAQSAEDRPDGFKCIAECRRTFVYDSTGEPVNYLYNSNPPWVAMDRFLHFFQRRFRDRLDIAQQKFRDRIFWPSVTEWDKSCFKLIPWDRAGNGVNVFVPRAEFHGGWVGDVTMAQVLDEVCGQSFTFWQDDGEQIGFRPPGAQEPAHHFHPGNITRPPQRSVQRLRRRTNRFIGRFRDVEDQFLGAASVEPPDNTPQHRLREDSINRVGEVRTERALGNMTYSQAQRIMEYIARLEHDNPVRVNLVGNATAIHLLKGDFVTVSHPVLGWEYQLCLVLTVRLRSAEESADECEFTLQKIDGPLYDDTAHRPRQEALTL